MKAPTRFTTCRFILHGNANSPFGRASICLLRTKRYKPVGSRVRFKSGVRKKKLKVWLKCLILSTARLARHHSWYHLFSLLPIAVASEAAIAIRAKHKFPKRLSRLRGCPQHLLL